jgi:hypothetical protein
MFLLVLPSHLEPAKQLWTPPRPSTWPPHGRGWGDRAEFLTTETGVVASVANSTHPLFQAQLTTPQNMTTASDLLRDHHPGLSLLGPAAMQ